MSSGRGLCSVCEGGCGMSQHVWIRLLTPTNLRNVSWTSLVVASLQKVDITLHFKSVIHVDN